MRTAGRWLFGDIASVVAPRVERGPRSTPTRRAARWLIGIGLFVTFVGVVGYAGQKKPLERQPATVVGRYTKEHFGTKRSASSTIHYVRLRLEDGTRTSIPQAPLYDAVGTRTGLGVDADVSDTDNVDGVYLEGRRYGTGRHTAGQVITLLWIALGVYLLLRGIGRRRRARLAERPAGA